MNEGEFVPQKKSLSILTYTDTDVHLYNALGDYKLDLPKEAIERVQAGESSEAVLTPEQRETLYNFFASCLLYEIFEADNEERPVSFSYGEVVDQEKVVFVLHKFNEHFEWYPDGRNLADFYTEESTGLSEDCEASDALNALFAQVERYDRISLFGKVLNVLGIRIEVGDDTLYGWYEGDDLDSKAAALTERLIEEHKEEFPEEFPEEYESEDDEYDDEYDEDEYADEDEENDEVDDEQDDAANDSSPRKS